MWGKVLSGAMAASVLVLSGCGGGGSSDRPAKEQATAGKAYFVDSAVTGLRYKCGNGSFKLTGELGLLSCNVGQTVSFYIGDILLGKAKMASTTGFITPLTLATEGETVDENKMSNIARFLISLDSDSNPGNGIQIDPAVHLNTGLVLDFSLTGDSFESSVGPVLAALSEAVDGEDFLLVSEADAMDHLVIGLFVANAGYYEGTVKRGEGATSKLAFLVTRNGAAYGVNRSADGLYVAAGHNEEAEHFDPFGSSVEFMIDGETGATYFLDAQAGGGKVTGSTEEMLPTFTATRRTAFEPLVDYGLVDALDNLVPFAIDLTGNEDYFIIDYSPGNLMAGTLYSAANATPPSENPDMEVVPYGFVMADMVSGKDGVMRLMAISTNGYVVDINIDFNGEEPALNAKWKHVFENRSGVSSTYVTHFEYGDDFFIEEPIALSAQKSSAVKAAPGRRGAGSSGMFQ